MTHGNVGVRVTDLGRRWVAGPDGHAELGLGARVACPGYLRPLQTPAWSFSLSGCGGHLAGEDLINPTAVQIHDFETPLLHVDDFA